MRFQHYMPTRVLFGAGQLNHLHKQNLPGKKALLVISSGKSTRANGSLARTEDLLQKAGVETVIFDGVQANPLKSTVMAGAAMARQHDCDFIVALGGGSCMDASKAIAAMATNEGDCWDYVHGGTGRGLPLLHKPLPIVAITTTAGTGSEVDQYGVITNEETQEKIGFGGTDDLFPVLAIVDPELMTSVPPLFTAYQGFDALFHSIEGYVSRFANPMSDMYALTAIENISKSLPKAILNGNDLDAREAIAFANTLSGIVMVVGAVTSQHSLEHAMSAYHQELPHGAGLIMLSKAYFTHLIESKVCDDRFIRMAKAMGMDNAKEPMDFIHSLTSLQEACGVANLKMSDYGITPESFDSMAKNAKTTMGGLFQCDRKELTIDDCVSIYSKSYR